jgi:hypothetical protein
MARLCMPGAEPCSTGACPCVPAVAAHKWLMQAAGRWHITVRVATMTVTNGCITGVRGLCVRLLIVTCCHVLQVWDGETLELLREVKAAHGGERIYCATFGPDKLLYTGGDDKVGCGACGWQDGHSSRVLYLSAALPWWRRHGPPVPANQHLQLTSLLHSARHLHAIAKLLSGPPVLVADAPLVPLLQMIRVWDPASLEAVAGRGNMCHEASVRALAAGPNSCLMSGCANGELAIWSL